MILSTLDASSRYSQIKIAKEDPDKSLFNSHSGPFRFTDMPFRLKNSAWTFPPAMMSCWWKSCDSLRLCIWTISWYYCIRSTNISIMLDKRWRYYTRQAWHLIWRSANFYDIYWLPWPCSSPRAHGGVNTNNWRNTQTRLPDYSDRTSSIFLAV